jgi:hypothetical protein
MFTKCIKDLITARKKNPMKTQVSTSENRFDWSVYDLLFDIVSNLAIQPF